MLKSSALTLKLNHYLLSWDKPQGLLLRQTLFDTSGVCLNEDIIKELKVWVMRQPVKTFSKDHRSTGFT